MFTYELKRDKDKGSPLSVSVEPAKPQCYCGYKSFAMSTLRNASQLRQRAREGLRNSEKKKKGKKERKKSRAR